MLRATLSARLIAVGWLAVFGCASASAGPVVKGPSEPLPRDVVARAALPLVGRQGDVELDERALFDRLAEPRVVCFGETHDSPAHHFAQLRVLEELSQRAEAAGHALGVGFEMFQRPYQAALTRYVKGALDEPALLEQSDYDERWGFDFSLYRPLLEQTRTAGLDALALNAPRELARKVARRGVSGLSDDERALLPEMVLDDAEHRAYFDRAMSAHPMPPGGPKPDDMYAAQVLWDETMAETAANWLVARDDSAHLIIFAGTGHCHRSAIPARLARRTSDDVLSVAPMLASKLAEHDDESQYDLIVVLQD